MLAVKDIGRTSLRVQFDIVNNTMSIQVVRLLYCSLRHGMGIDAKDIKGYINGGANR
jgi:hypothetical protein